MIISASRRTDIPAFYAPWFINRVRAGCLLTRNPRNANQVRRVSLYPEDVDVIVFWTRNPRPLFPFLAELDSLGYKYYFQYTLTGYPRILEPHVPQTNNAIEAFCDLSDYIGPDRIIWRYDPILLSNYTGLDYHISTFLKLATQLAGKTRKVVISFADLYGKTIRNLDKVSGIQYMDIRKTPGLLHLLSNIIRIAKSFGMTVETCAETSVSSSLSMTRGKCIDDALIQRVFGINLTVKKDRSQRKACGCVESVDIGQYNTCLHGCTYCYATTSLDAVQKKRQQHNPDSPFLIGDLREGEEMFLLTKKKQMPLL
ncbi:MAG: DUF1848 domain-containing protein [Candidatus Magasanikbacteria bacterium]|jgi:hypothetical protein|nr:DUF1848 domain-containing protein [Candidatus Magasanikbacteria bacterium]MBT4071813.1 DUF1848 domain-containing protein [Candidatus Magasanikbacteria bacterium]